MNVSFISLLSWMTTPRCTWRPSSISWRVGSPSFTREDPFRQITAPSPLSRSSTRTSSATWPLRTEFAAPAAQTMTPTISTTQRKRTELGELIIIRTRSRTRQRKCVFTAWNFDFMAFFISDIRKPWQPSVPLAARLPVTACPSSRSCWRIG